ncbi:MAG: hypothetical protein V1792_16005 [Pseudomonadota bacterium]
MTLDVKRALLKSLYRIYDETLQHHAKACHAGCSVCCTRNVLCTTLEADLVIDRLEKTNRLDLVERFAGNLPQRIARPSITVNELAGYCLRREEPPEQDVDHAGGPCPILEDGMCPVYEVRPFGCRCLWSREICGQHGEALMDPVLISLNGIFEQTIEHMDKGGLYGNLLDLLSALVSVQNRDSYRSGRPLPQWPHLPATRPNPGFLVPPLHRPTVIKALNRLLEQRIGGITFREVLRQIR